MSNERKRSSWFRWMVGAIIALIGAGGGLVAVLRYLDSKQEDADRQYRQELAEWENFSPQSVSRGAQNVELRGFDWIDLETGRVTSNVTLEPGSADTWDLQFVCHTQARESLRASSGIEWSDLGVVDFSAVGYRDIRDAPYESGRHASTGYSDLYYAHKSNVPGQGYAFAVRTPANNVAKVQIVSYRSVDPNPAVCRNVTLRYEVFPVVADPPRPRQR